MVAFTPNRLLAQPAVGGDVGVWGPPLNNNQTILDQILSQAVTISFAGASTDVLVSQAQMQFLQLTLTGTPSASTVRLSLFPNLSGFWFIQNSTPNTVTVVTGVGGSIGVSVGPGTNTLVRSDGTNVTGLSTSTPIRTFVGPGVLTVGAADSTILVQQSTPAILSINLPATGGPFTIADSAGVSGTFNFTLTPASGTINGRPTFVMNVNYQSVTLVPNGAGYNIT